METAAIVSAIGYKAAIGASVALGTSTMIITRSDTIGCWIWRSIHRCGTYRVVFDRSCCTKQEEIRLMQYLAQKASNIDFRFLQNYSFVSNPQTKQTSHIDIPNKGFMIQNEHNYIYVQPLMTHSGIVCGYDFWSCSWFGWNSRRKTRITRNHIKSILRPAQIIASDSGACGGAGAGAGAGNSQVAKRSGKRFSHFNMEYLT